ncbi:MAG: hypothetical protein ACRDE7_00840 [Sphingobacterium sp.]
MINPKMKDVIFKKQTNSFFMLLLLLLSNYVIAEAQQNQQIWEVPNGKLLLNLRNGTVDYQFTNGIRLNNTVAYVDLLPAGKKASTDFSKHEVQKQQINDSLGHGQRLVFTHSHAKGVPDLQMKQIFTYYESNQGLLIAVEISSVEGKVLESRDISPISIEPGYQGKATFPWEEPILVDLPFDNDNWGKLLPLPWPTDVQQIKPGTSHELTMIYDAVSHQGLTMGSLEHDFWKTGIRYNFSSKPGELLSLTTYGGAARADDPSLPLNYGGKDGTHDMMPHGTMLSKVLCSPLIYMEASKDIVSSNTNYGKMQAKLAGSQSWQGKTPMYWNSFSVEDVLGHYRVMMPKDVYKIIDFLKVQDQLNQYGQPILSIDSYDQQIYSTEVLTEIGDYARQAGQELGFYSCPFSLWTWKSNIETAILPGTEVPLREVILRDQDDVPIPFKTGDWGAFPLDPTHPATKDYMINQLTKAKTIGAKFIKIDFLTAGSFEAKKWYDPKIRTGMQAYNYGLKTFKHLLDSIMGDDVFISMAISPMFPHQYAHTRFVSTDVHSHLRDDQEGFEHYGSTAASMITASHMGWVQGTLWPFTNMDNLVMRKFQDHKELSIDEVEARIISLMTMGSILGDGSDYRDSLSAKLASQYLNNPRVAEFFSHPKAFQPIKLSKGDSMDQQLTFFLPGEEFLLAAFNFEQRQGFSASFDLQRMGLPPGKYQVLDFFTGNEIAQIDASDKQFVLPVEIRKARLVRLVSAH